MLHFQHQCLCFCLQDGVVLMHTVRKGQYMRTISLPQERGWDLTVEQLAISDIGHVCVYSRQTHRHHKGVREITDA